MDVLAVYKGVFHGFVAADMGEQTQLYLAVVSIYQNLAVLSNKHFSEFRTQL